MRYITQNQPVETGSRCRESDSDISGLPGAHLILLSPNTEFMGRDLGGPSISATGGPQPLPRTFEPRLAALGRRPRSRELRVCCRCTVEMSGRNTRISNPVQAPERQEIPSIERRVRGRLERKGGRVPDDLRHGGILPWGGVLSGKAVGRDLPAILDIPFK